MTSLPHQQGHVFEPMQPMQQHPSPSPMLNMILRTLLAAIVATATACWTVRGTLAEFATRVSVLEDRGKDQVQRGEFAAARDANAAALVDIKRDLREIERQQTEMMLRMPAARAP